MNTVVRAPVQTWLTLQSRSSSVGNRPNRRYFIGSLSYARFGWVSAIGCEMHLTCVYCRLQIMCLEFWRKDILVYICIYMWGQCIVLTSLIPEDPMICSRWDTVGLMEDESTMSWYSSYGDDERWLPLLCGRWFILTMIVRYQKII